jgi:hypothetical protein
MRPVKNIINVLYNSVIVNTISYSAITTTLVSFLYKNKLVSKTELKISRENGIEKEER